MNLADSVIGGAVAIETAKAQKNANSGAQQQVAAQPQVPQVVPQQANVSNPTSNNNSKMLIIGGVGAGVLLLVILLTRK